MMQIGFATYVRCASLCGENPGGCSGFDWSEPDRSKGTGNCYLLQCPDDYAPPFVEAKPNYIYFAKCKSITCMPGYTMCPSGSTQYNCSWTSDCSQMDSQTSCPGAVHPPMLMSQPGPACLYESPPMDIGWL